MSPPQQNYHFVECSIFFPSANIYDRVTTESDLMSYNKIFHFQSVLCLTTTATRSSSVKMSPPQQNIVIYQKNQETG